MLLRLGLRTLSGTGDFAMKPDFRRAPFVLDRRRRHTDDLGRIFQVETSEIPKLDDLALAWIKLGKAIQRIVEGQHIGRLSASQRCCFIQRYLSCVSTPFGSGVGSCVFDKDASHRLGRNR